MIKYLLLLLLILVMGSSLVAAKVKVFKEDIELKGSDKISIKSSYGDVIVESHSGRTIEVELKSFKNGPKLFIERGSEILIETKKDFLSFFSFNFKKPILKVYIPKSYEKDLYIKNSSGNVDISNLELRLFDLNLSSGHTQIEELEAVRSYIKSSSGRVNMRRVVSEDLELRVSSGSIEISELKGEKAYIKSSSGSIDINDINIDNTELIAHSGRVVINELSGNIQGKSSSGSVKIYLNSLNGDIEYRLSSGSFLLQVDDDKINANVNLHTTSGRVVSDFPIESKGSFKKNKIIGLSGSDDYRVDVYNTSGNISLKEK